MFKIIDRRNNTYTVYSTRSRIVEKNDYSFICVKIKVEVTEFLIRRSMLWVWVDSEDYTPLFDC